MDLKDMKGLLEHEVKDLLYAERHLVKALPKMAKAASDAGLQKAIEQHLEETKVHVERLEQVCAMLEIGTRGEKCEAMEGLLEEAQEIIKAEGDEAVIDAALISSAQRVEHYEMAAYGSARAFAEQLGLGDVARLLQRTLDEEGEANKKLTQIAEQVVNPRAAEATAKA